MNERLWDQGLAVYWYLPDFEVTEVEFFLPMISKAI